MQHAICHGPYHATLDFQLNAGDEVMAEPESLLAMSTGIEISARVAAQTQSRWWGAARSLASGESMFTAIFRSKRDGTFLSLAPRFPGDILAIACDEGSQYYLTQGSYLASIQQLTIQFQYAGFKGLMAKKGVFLMKTAGHGQVFCSSYGTVVTKELADGENFVVDNRFVIAFSQSITYQLVKASNDLVGSYFSGGGLVNRYTGPGRLFYQTRGKPSQGLFGRMFDLAT
jgi:uncharacterized protein (TIGR00266 family)